MKRYLTGSLGETARVLEGPALAEGADGPAFAVVGGGLEGGAEDEARTAFLAAPKAGAAAAVGFLAAEVGRPNAPSSSPDAGGREEELAKAAGTVRGCHKQLASRINETKMRAN